MTDDQKPMSAEKAADNALRSVDDPQTQTPGEQAYEMAQLKWLDKGDFANILAKRFREAADAAHAAGKSEGAAEEREKLDEWRGEVRYIRWDVHERSVEQEREACARIADQEASTIGDDGYEGEVWVAVKIAAAIRARTEGESQ